MPAREFRPVVEADRPGYPAFRDNSLPTPASLSGSRNLYPLPAPDTPACRRPPRSAPGSPVRTPPHRARNPAPTPGSPQSAPAAAVPTRAQCFRFFRRKFRPRLPIHPMHPLVIHSLRHLAATAPATADTRTAASPAPTPPAACATLHPCASSGSGNSIPPSPSARRPGAHSLRTPIAASSRPTAVLRAPSVFCDQRFQHLLVQTQIHHQLLQARVLIAQLLGFLRLAHIHPPVLRLPRVDRVLRHPDSRGPRLRLSVPLLVV